MQKFINNYETTLIYPISDTYIYLEVAVASVFDDIEPLGVGDYYLLTLTEGPNTEIIRVNTVTAAYAGTHQLVVDRDASGSGHGSFAFTTAAKVSMNITAEGMNALATLVESATASSFNLTEATADPTTAPLAVGAHWVNTLSQSTFTSVGTSSSADWVRDAHFSDIPTSSIPVISDRDARTHVGGTLTLDALSFTSPFVAIFSVAAGSTINLVVSDLYGDLNNKAIDGFIWVYSTTPYLSTTLPVIQAAGVAVIPTGTVPVVVSDILDPYLIRFTVVGFAGSYKWWLEYVV
jgi:hypothetical protein